MTAEGSLVELPVPSFALLDDAPPVQYTVESAKAALEAMGGSFLFEKVCADEGAMAPAGALPLALH